MTKFIDMNDVVSLIPDGATCVTDGMTLMGLADEILARIAKSFIDTGHPRDLTWVQAAGQSNRVHGVARLAHKGLLKRVIGSHWGLTPPIAQLLGNDEAEAVCLPQGQISTLYRTIAAKRPGQLSTVGLGTFVDPRIDGGRFNESAKRNIAPDEYVEVVTLHGKEYLMYKPFKLDIAIIRGSAMDTLGNLSHREEVSGLDALGIAQAVHNSGGVVIAQVKQIVDPGGISARDVTVPAALIDYAAVCTDPRKYHKQSHSYPEFCADLISGYASPENLAEAMEAQSIPEQRVSIGQRGVELVRIGDVINVGTGIPADTIGKALARAGLLDRVHLTVESGTYGGVPLGVVDFGASIHPQAIIGHPQQMDFYDGGGVDITFMGVGQVDPAGRFNVSKLGGRAIGCGGFMDITDGAKTICFLMSAESKHPKFVETVDQVTFDSTRACANGKAVFLATEYYLLEFTDSGWKIREKDDNSETERALEEIRFALSGDQKLTEDK